MYGRRIRSVSMVFLSCALLRCAGAGRPAADAPVANTRGAEASPAMADRAVAQPAQTDILPESIASAGRAGSTGWARKPGVALFAGDTLFEYIDGAAEMYHKYGFIDLRAAEYEKDSGTVTVDVYRFSSSDMAFGMYTTLRPDPPDTVMLGVEGFTFDTNWIYVKGPYLVNVYTYDAPRAEVRAVATAIETGLPGTANMPGAFAAFPGNARVAYSEKIYAEAFLSQEVLSDVYAIDYERGGHRFTLFATDDPGSAKLEAWGKSVEEERGPDMGYQHLPYDGSRYLHTSDSYRGEIIAGPIGGKLVGMVGYRPDDVQVLLEWLQDLAGQP